MLRAIRARLKPTKSPAAAAAAELLAAAPDAAAPPAAAEEAAACSKLLRKSASEAEATVQAAEEKKPSQPRRIYAIYRAAAQSIVGRADTSTSIYSNLLQAAAYQRGLSGQRKHSKKHGPFEAPESDRLSVERLGWGRRFFAYADCCC